MSITIESAIARELERSPPSRDVPLSAQAAVEQYEIAAKEIDAMGADLIDRVKQCEAMTRDALAVVEQMEDTAAKYREEAKRIFDQIEGSSLMTAEVRRTCVELKTRIAAASS